MGTDELWGIAGLEIPELVHEEDTWTATTRFVPYGERPCLSRRDFNLTSECLTIGVTAAICPWNCESSASPVVYS